VFLKIKINVDNKLCIISEEKRNPFVENLDLVNVAKRTGAGVKKRKRKDEKKLSSFIFNSEKSLLISN